MAYSIDGPTKTITLTAGTVTMSVRDAWSRWVDWWITGDNSKYLPAFATVGGNNIDIDAGTSVPIYAFLLNGWHIKPQEANHTLTVTGGILLVDGGGEPFISTDGSYIVQINYQQPVQAITVNTVSEGGEETPNPWDTVLEGELTTGDAMRLMLAVLMGKSDKNNDTVTFWNYTGSQKRIEITLAGPGKRTAVTIDSAS